MQTTEPLVSKSGMSALQRPRYGAGLLLEAEDLTAGVNYTRELLRLLTRSLFGCGVVCGLEVTAKSTCEKLTLQITVGEGLALDSGGNPIHVPGPVTITYDPRPKCKTVPPTVWVTACYLEKCCQPKNVACSPDEDGTILHTRSHDGFEIKVYETRPSCACACTPEDPTKPPTKNCERYADHNKGKCGCACECVLLAEIDTTKAIVKDATTQVEKEEDLASTPETDPRLKATTREVRYVRPVLTGYLPCLQTAP